MLVKKRRRMRNNEIKTEDIGKGNKDIHPEDRGLADNDGICGINIVNKVIIPVKPDQVQILPSLLRIILLDME